MFGGLEIKGSGGSHDKEDAAAAAPAPASTSAFGFLNAPTTETSSSSEAPAAPSGSGFSFLSSSASEPSSEPPAAPPVASSGFSFLQEMTTTTTTATTAAPEPVAEPASSGFSFLIPSPTNAASASASGGGGGGGASATTPTTTETPPPTVGSGEAAQQETTSSSGFSFLSSSEQQQQQQPESPSSFAFLTPMGGPSPASDPEPPPPTAPAIMTIVSSSSSAAPSPNTTSTSASLELSAASAPSMPFGTGISSSFGGIKQPAGAGISFGSSVAGVRKKKKTRALKVGMGATTSSSMIPAAPVVAPVVAAAPVAAPVAAAETNTNPNPNLSPTSARDAAAEAAHRADAFMHQKTMQQQQQHQVEIPSYGTTTTTSTSNSPPAIHFTASTDEEVAEAQKAAEEAMSMSSNHQNQKVGGSGFMGTFFKGFGGTVGGGGTTATAHAMNGGGGTRSDRRGPSPSPPIINSGSGSGDLGDNVVDRLAKQQQDMKRAMAERQMQMQQQQQQPHDNEVVSTTTTTTASGGWVPIVVESSSREQQHQPQQQQQQPPPPPARKKKKTPTQVFEEYQGLFAQSVHQAMQQVETVRSQQKMLSEERFVGLAKERLIEQQIKQTESQLQVAVEAEEYELADQLGQVIEARKRETSEVSLMLQYNAKAMHALDSQKTLVVQGAATCFDNLAHRLNELQLKQQASGEHSNGANSEHRKQFETISKQLSAEHERLQQDCKNIERDSQLVADERTELEGAISEQTGNYESQQTVVKDKLSNVEQEIEELRNQLEAKQTIAAELRTEMHGFGDAISKVRVKFSRQLNRVDKKEWALQENRKEWELEQATYQRQKVAHDMQVQSHSEALLAHDILMERLESELKLANEFASLVPTKFGFMEDQEEQEKGTSAEEHDSNQKRKKEEDDTAEGDLAQMQADVVKSEAAVSDAKSFLKAATAAIANLEREHETLIANIPDLETQKKAAAAKRDYKAASKASKEIKDATLRLKDCEEELVGDAANRKTAAEEELTRLDGELVKAQKIAQEKEKLSGQIKMATLAKKIQTLVATKQELCGETTSSENSVRGVGALVLDCQIKALKDQGQDLGSKYGGWNELMKGILEEEGGDDDDGDDEAKENVPNAEEEVEPEQEEQNETSEDKTSASAPDDDDGLTSEERIAKVKALIKRIKESEEALEAAATREDFDEAAELHELFSNLQSDLENINLTDEESEIAFAEDDETAPPAEEEEEATSPSEETPPIEEAASEEKGSEEPAPAEETISEEKGSEEPAPAEEAPAEAISEENTDNTAADGGGGNDQADEEEVEDVTNEAEGELEGDPSTDGDEIVENGHNPPTQPDTNAEESSASKESDEAPNQDTTTEVGSPE